MPMYNGKGVICSDKATENYHVTPLFLSALQSVSVSFSSLFWLHGPQLC